MMKKLHFKENFKNFLYDNENAIAIYDNELYVFNYVKLEKLSNSEILLILSNLKLKINGINLKLKQMSKKELLILGNFNKLEFYYE